MNKKIKITESQYNRIFNVKNDVTPLNRLMECRITKDYQYIYFENNFYEIKTGQQVINEGILGGLTKSLGVDDWSLSDVLHTATDVLSTGMDFVLPGSGAIIDVVHALSYLVEAEYNPSEKDTLYTMAAITFAFAIMPGALQMVAPAVKRFVKSGGKMVLGESDILIKAFNIIKDSIGKITSKLPNLVDKAVNSSLGKKILGDSIPKIKSVVKDFTSRVKGVMDNLITKTTQKGKNAVDKVKKGMGIKPKTKWQDLKVKSKAGKEWGWKTQNGQNIIRHNPKLQKDFVLSNKGKWYPKDSPNGKMILNMSKKYKPVKSSMFGGVSEKYVGLKKKYPKLNKTLRPANPIWGIKRGIELLKNKELKKGAYYMIGYGTLLQLYAAEFHHILCKFGIRNREEYEDMVNLHMEYQKNNDGLVGGNAVNALIALWNISGNLMAEYGEALFNPNCKTNYTILSTFIDEFMGALPSGVTDSDILGSTTILKQISEWAKEEKPEGTSEEDTERKSGWQ